jgi:hypothetical protein
MTSEQNTPLQKEQQLLEKPLGLKRPLSWLLFLPVLLAFLILPIVAIMAPEFFGTSKNTIVEQKPKMTINHAPLNAHPMLQSLPTKSEEKKPRNTTALALDSIWNPGPLSSAHSNLEGDCQACHIGNFSRVKDENCLVCHSNMGLHVSQEALPETSFEEGRCASCHRDHKGRESLAEQNKHFVGIDCATCHKKIMEVAPKTSTLEVSDFLDNKHPGFRVTVSTGPEPTDLRRIRMTSDKPITEKTNLKFPHDLHLNPKGINSPNKKVVMECANCHEPADTVTGFKTLSMENHCQDCHKLSFEPALPDRQVPHGPVDKVLSTIEEFYSYLALHPEDRHKVNSQRAILRARPGENGAKLSNLGHLSGNPYSQAAFATVELFENTACAVCHEVKAINGIGKLKTSGSRLPQYQIAEINPTHSWMPMAKFNHKAHEFESCESCHNAGKSKNASEVLMPSIEGCQSCHSGSKSVLNKVQSDCGLCHEYHIHNKVIATK